VKRLTAEQRLAVWESTPVINTMHVMVKQDVDTLRRFLLRMHMPLKPPTLQCVARVRTQLGPQDYCWLGGSEGRRYYVWELNGDRARVFVHNEGGISFEVNPKLTPREHLHELRKFVARLEGRSA